MDDTCKRILVIDDDQRVVMTVMQFFVPIIMLTGVDTSEAKMEANYEYAEDYVVKPFEWPVLERKIARVLALRPRL